MKVMQIYHSVLEDDLFQDTTTLNRQNQPTPHFYKSTKKQNGETPNTETSLHGNS
jgi:hypothetical protein